MLSADLQLPSWQGVSLSQSPSPCHAQEDIITHILEYQKLIKDKIFGFNFHIYNYLQNSTDM